MELYRHENHFFSPSYQYTNGVTFWFSWLHNMSGCLMNHGSLYIVHFMYGQHKFLYRNSDGLIVMIKVMVKV